MHKRHANTPTVPSVTSFRKAAIAPSESMFTATITFGLLLRHLRKRAGMTQRDLAAALGYSDSLISNLEKGQRQPDLNAVTERFIAALGLQDDPHTAAHLIEQAALVRGERPPASVTFQRTTQVIIGEESSVGGIQLPMLPTEVIGRSAEVNQLCNRLLGHGGRLLTLVGAPGVGKTTLAVAVAAQLQHYFRDGIIFVSLATVNEPTRVATVLAAALGIKDVSKKPANVKLIEFLRYKELLLLLDNFEQIMPAAPLVAELLAECPGLCILVTSRERLHLRAEQRFKVLPLSIASAVELFILRSQAIDAAFEPTPPMQVAIAEVCLQLDCLPLAIELSAAYMDLFSPQQLLTRLQARKLDILNGGMRDLPARQQTLRNAIHYSYELLDEPEKRLFRALGVFVGGFEVAAVNAFGHYEESLRLLFNKSLVNKEKTQGERQRFSLLETLREYAYEQLVSAGEMPQVLERHLRFYVELAENGERELVSDEYSTWLTLLDADYGNLRLALMTAAQLETVELELRLASALRLYWRWRALVGEGRSYLAHALQRATNQQPNELYAKALFAAGYLAIIQSARLEARIAFSSCVEIYIHLQDPDKQALALAWQGRAHLDLGEYEAALACVEQSTTIFRASSTEEAQQGLAQALNVFGYIKSTMGDLPAARTMTEESLTLYRAQGDQSGIALMLYRLGHVDLLSQQYEAAYAKFAESLRTHEERGDRLNSAAIHYFLGYISRKRKHYAEGLIHLGAALNLYIEMGNTGSIVGTLTEIAKVAAEQSQFLRAATLFAKASALREAIQEKEWKALPEERSEYEQFIMQLRTALEPQAFEAAWTIGSTMSLEQTVMDVMHNRPCSKRAKRKVAEEMG